MRWFGNSVVEQLPVLRRYARALTRDDAAADDLVHDALVLAYEKQKTFRANGNLRAWLLSIVHNSFISGQRREKAERTRIQQAAEVADSRMPPPQEHALRLAALDEAVLQLPGEQRAVLHLIIVEGLSYGEAAAALGVPVGTIMSRLSRARMSLRSKERLPTAAPTDTPTEKRLRIVGGTDEHEP